MKKLLIITFKVILSAGSIYWVLHKVSLKEIGDIFLKIKPGFIIIAIVFFIISKVISSLRLNGFMKNININMSESEQLKLYLLGMYYNLFLPGGIGGDGYKIWLLTKKFNVNAGNITKVILLDRITGLLSLFFLLSIFSITLPISLFYKLVILTGGILSFFIFKFFSLKILPGFESFFTRSNILSLGVQIFQVICALFVLMSLGISDSLLLYIFIFLISSVVSVIPITIGGIGAREFTFLFLGGMVNLDKSSAISLSVIFFIITAFVSFFGVFYSFNNIKIKQQLC